MKLDVLQKQFQAYLLGESSEIDKHVHPPKRLSVYGDGYFSRLLSILKIDFPGLLHHLGEDAFENLAYDYLETYPSQSPSVRHLGQALTLFLKKSDLYQHQPFLSELAMFEWALSTAIDSPNAPVLTAQALATIKEADWPGIRFTPHPTVQLLVLNWNVPDIRSAAHTKQPTHVTPLKHPAPITWVVWRKGINPYYLALTPQETVIMQQMRERATFENLCLCLCDVMPEEEAAPYIVQQLLRWINEEMISSI